MLGHAGTGGPRLGVNLCAGRNRNVKKSREVSGKRIRIMKNGAGAMSACPVSFIRLPRSTASARTECFLLVLMF
jgi:hypothetical protein